MARAVILKIRKPCREINTFKNPVFLPKPSFGGFGVVANGLEHLPRSETRDRTLAGGLEHLPRSETQDRTLAGGLEHFRDPASPPWRGG